MYIEASAPRKSGDIARLESQLYSAGEFKGLCVNFWYHMYGQDIGALDIYIEHSKPSVDVSDLYNFLVSPVQFYLFITIFLFLLCNANTFHLSII